MPGYAEFPIPHKKLFFLNDAFHFVEKGYVEDLLVDYKGEIEERGADTASPVFLQHN